MNVQEMIEMLEDVEDKSLEVRVTADDIYMSIAIAKQLCNDLNSGRVVL